LASREPREVCLEGPVRGQITGDEACRSSTESFVSRGLGGRGKNIRMGR